MPTDLTFLDQLEEWLEAQVPPNLHELPHRMFETMERVSNEIFESLNIHGPPSISIPFPPFGKETPLPPPPPSPPITAPTALAHKMCSKADKLYKAHPYFLLGGAALTGVVGLSLGTVIYKYGLISRIRSAKEERCRGMGLGLVEDGMLKEAVVLLCPNVMPALLGPLTVTLLKAGYIVLVAVPKVSDAENLEKRLGGLEERGALRVLIYDPQDPTTFTAFHRSLQATLTLRFPATTTSSSSYTRTSRSSSTSTGTQTSPRIHAFISLYPLNPSPPAQPGSLPALPTLISPDGQGRSPKLITLYPSDSILVTPESFANQILTANHLLLSKNLAVSTNSTIMSVYLGNINIPHIHSMILSTAATGKNISRRQAAKEQLRLNNSTTGKITIMKDYLVGSLHVLWKNIAATFGIGDYSRDYGMFEKRFLRILRSSSNHHGRFGGYGGYGKNGDWSLGQYSFLNRFIAGIIPFRALPLVLSIIPSTKTIGSTTSSSSSSSTSSKNTNTPGNLGTSRQSQGKPTIGLGGPKRPLSSKSSTASTASASSSDHEGSPEDLVSSIHTTGTTGTGISISTSTTSSGRDESASGENSEGSGLEGSWVGLDSASVGGGSGN